MVRHKSEIRDIKVRAVDGAKVVVQIKEEESMRGGMGRQNIGAQGNRVQRVGHFDPIFAVARVGRRTGERELAVRANIGIGRQERAIGDVFRGKKAQTLAILAGLRNYQLNGFRVKANRRVIIVPEINFNGHNTRSINGILAEDFFFVALSPEVWIRDDGQVLMRVARLQGHRIRGRSRALGKRPGGQKHHEGKSRSEHDLVGYDAPSWK